MAARAARKGGRRRRSSKAGSDRPRGARRDIAAGEGAPDDGDLDGIRTLYEDRDVLVLERTPLASQSALRRAIGQRSGDGQRARRRGAWPVGTLESGVTGLLLLARSPAARRNLEREGGARFRYLAAALGTGRAERPRASGTTPEPTELRRIDDWHLLELTRSRPHRDLAGWLLRRGYRVLRASAPSERLYLHAAGLSFDHPVTGKSLIFESRAPSDLESPLRSTPSGDTRGASPSAPADRRAPPVSDSPAGSSTPPRRAAPTSGTSPRAAARPGRPVPTDWNEVADWLDTLLEAREHDHYRDVILPGVLRLLEPVSGLRALDLACGQGILCRALAEHGVQTVGVEAAPRLVEHARERSASVVPRPEFHVADVRQLRTLDLGRFDRAACILALTNFDPIGPVLRACGRLLRPGGLFVAVIPHPAFRIPRHTHWEWHADPETGAPRQSRRIDTYRSPLRLPIVANPGAVAHGERAIETWTFHRPLEHYVRDLVAAGLWIDRLEEWTSARTSRSGPRAPEENRARREIPLFLALRARIPPR